MALKGEIIMCGILAVLGKVEKVVAQREARKMSHRGPDEEGIYQSPKDVTLCHQRLSIVDLHTGHQPLVMPEDLALVHNGEIYNHEQLYKELDGASGLDRISKSDSEIILHLYKALGPAEAIKKLDGVFAFVLTDQGKIFVGRDPIGVKPLFFGRDELGRMWFASEHKSLQMVCDTIDEFPPGHYYTQEEGFVEYYQPKYRQKDYTPASMGEKLHELLEEAVDKRLMSDVPLGVLLSGGLDSSLVASITARKLAEQGKKVKSFSVGVDARAYDLVAARKVAEHIGSEHHEIHFSVEEGLVVLEELIHRLESYDVTTIRSATPMYIMMKEIARQGVKVVMSGEGADEIFGGYMYFNNAPSDQEFHEETSRRVGLLHTSDVLRADRATMGAGVEARVPFLDLKFVEHSMSIKSDLRRPFSGKRIEKWVLRDAFDCKERPYLPEEILWRQKEQFQDGVGYSWVDGLKEHCERSVTDKEFAQRHALFPVNTPSTKEAFYFRKIYAKHFPHHESGRLVKKWIPRWQEGDLDPSGRASKHHNMSYHTKEEEVVAV